MSIVVADSRKQSVGAHVLALSTGRLLLGQRSKLVDEPGLWSTFGGGVDAGESHEEALYRELEEEAGFRGEFQTFDFLWTGDGPRVAYHNYLCVIEDEFTPVLNFETSTYLWFEPSRFPRPLHFGVQKCYQQPEARALLLDWLRRIAKDASR